MILLIDNYDSFSYNLFQLIGSLNPDIKVIRNDAASVKEIEEMKPEAIIISPELMHGKQSDMTLDRSSPIFQGLPDRIPVARYHSLALVEETLPECLMITARTDNGEIMAIQHKAYPVYGLQFHPESILTPDGKSIAANFLKQVKVCK